MEYGRITFQTLVKKASFITFFIFKRDASSSLHIKRFIIFFSFFAKMSSETVELFAQFEMSASSIKKKFTDLENIVEKQSKDLERQRK